ncbi:molybdopterin-dependent oxidoreductase [Gymnodinialimonas sp. 2305UL16-5]|uniref:molybdopterin-dependent oxidoreductase n=1 Tax=Gymnodinialimonas mytili TaxID=3126503 RepID=UPI0030A3382D
MRYTAAHWGTYQFDNDGGLVPVDGDPAPARIGHGWVSAARDMQSRILAPVIRKGWLERDGGQARCDDSYVEVSWDEATERVADEIDRVRNVYGNGAIFGGSYGWASAGRFHHAQSHLRRFLNCAGGYVSARNTYSHAAAEVLWPYLLGLSNRAFQDQMTSLDEVAEHCDILLAFGGISGRTSQVTSSGTSFHEVPGWIDRLAKTGARIINISPRGSDMASAEWLSVRPGTDTALILALTQEIVAQGRADTEFLRRCTSGWGTYRAYLMGDVDGQAKTPDWAAAICDIPADQIRELAEQLTIQRSMIAMNWGMQRCDHGEQVIWAGLALACVVGQIGQPGTGFAFGYGSTTPVGRPARLINWPSLPQGQNPVDDFIPVARIADMLLRPGATYTYDGETRRYADIRLVYWTGGNPFHHHQDLTRLDRAWMRPETVIVQDHSWTATARRADIVLPATSPLERHDIMMNRRDPSLIYMSPLFDPPGAALDDYEIHRRIAAHLGLEDAFTQGRDAEGWLRHLWDNAVAIGSAEGIAVPDFDGFAAEGRFDVPDATEHRRALGDFVRSPDAHPLATESGRITLTNTTIAGFDLKDCPPHPTWMAPIETLLDAPDGVLHLISGQPDTRLHGQNDRGSEAQSDKVHGREPAYLHPSTADRLGLVPGDIIRLFNPRGACLAGLRLDPLLRTDCISLATGAWYDRQMVDGLPLEVHGNPNVLTIDKGCSGLSQGNIAHTALVEVEKWTGAVPPLSVDRPPEIAAMSVG